MTILDIPFINKNIPNIISNYNGLHIEPVYTDNSHLSLVLNKSYDLYSTPIYMNSRINYLDWQIYDNFINLHNGVFSYKPISNLYNKIRTHHIPRLPIGHKINDMFIPIKTTNYQYINSIDISNIIISYDDRINIKLNKNPILYIDIAKWDKKNTIIYETYELYFKMTSWSNYISINKCNISFNDILYITINAYDFLSIDDYLDNIHKLDSIYLRLCM